jgi:hypothetical protein
MLSIRRLFKNNGQCKRLRCPKSDIYYGLKNYPGGIDELIGKFHPHIHNALVKEGLNILLDKFSSPEQIGSRFVADFMEITDPEDRAALQRDVFERVAFLRKGLEL